MADDLLSVSAVRLFGREVGGVKLADLKKGAHKQLVAGLDDKNPLLARIYAFSFEGQFHTLPKPVLFLVRDHGVEAKKDTGLANIKNLEFEKEIKSWKYDKDDVILRADVVIGTLDDVLIDATFSAAPKYPIISRSATPQEASWRDGQMIARNRFQ